MSERSIRRIRLATSAAVGAALAASVFVGTAAAAQPAQAPQKADSDVETLDTVVVTGSLIRGVAPVGTNVSQVTTEDIKRTGAMSTNQILASIPQLTNAFNVIPVTPSGVGRSTFRPDLRNLGNVGHATTLVLIDGHNAVGSGILQTTPDAGMLPPGAIERVEVVADGGSSIYGSDAVGGIMNFITRTRFDGLQFNASRGFADHYDAYTASVTGGLDYSRGSAMFSVYYRDNSELFNQYRERPRQNLLPFGGSDFRTRNCAPGNITVGSTTYALPSRTPGLNLCDTTELGNLAPAETQAAVFGSLTYKVSDNLDLVAKTFISDRRTKNYGAQRTQGAGQITTANPFFRAIGTETSQTVAYSYAPVAGIRAVSRSALTAYHITPELTWTMGGGWRTKFTLDYARSNTTAITPAINATAEAAALRGANLTTATALNPYDLTLTNPSVIQTILNWWDQSGAVQYMKTARAIADGPLFHMTGGDARGAFGVQYQFTDIRGYEHVAPFGLLTGGNDVYADRKVSAVFAELEFPVIGEANARPGVKALDIDLSGRYDKYSDVGNTSNPKLGVTWTIVNGLKFRGNWGTSFTAPSLADTDGAVNRSVAVFATSTVRPGDNPNFRLRPEIRLQGGTSGLSPMPATTWSTGFDIEPAALPGFRASLTYWSVDMDKRVGLIPVGSVDLYNIAGYAGNYIINPTLAQALAAAAEDGGFLTGATSIQSVYGIGNDPYVLTDARRKNFGRLKVTGLDYSFAYRHGFGWGTFNSSINGVYKLKQIERAVAGADYVDRLANNTTRVTAQGLVGADIGKFTATATVNFTKGFPVLGVANQTSIGNFIVTNLFFRYAVNQDLNVTLNVDNVLDTKPPFANINGGVPNFQGFQLASTLGRYFNVGLSKTF